ncbi:MAG: hypothetical protein ACI4EE_04675 [Lachnospiraceae bacterium]
MEIDQKTIVDFHCGLFFVVFSVFFARGYEMRRGVWDENEKNISLYLAIQREVFDRNISVVWGSHVGYAFTQIDEEGC